jgi:hypothetical protein
MNNANMYDAVSKLQKHFRNRHVFSWPVNIGLPLHRVSTVRVGKTSAREIRSIFGA